MNTTCSEEMLEIYEAVKGILGLSDSEISVEEALEVYEEITCEAPLVGVL